MNILGIDPGSRNCGYAIIQLEKNTIFLVEAGLIKIKERILQHQILEFVEGIDLVFKNYQIDSVAIEDMFYAYNPKSVIKLAQFRGALSLKILQELGSFTEYHKRSIVIERGKQEKIRCRIITFQTVTVCNGTDKYNTGSESKLLYQLFYFLFSISRADKKHAERYIP